jgi:anhydro-N-acetylmuramic acid kinase
MISSIGLMSGTSMDGIDAGLIQSDGKSDIRELGHFSYRYEVDVHLLLKAAEYTVNQYKGDLQKMRNHNFEDHLIKFLKQLMGVTDDSLELKLKSFRKLLKNEIINYDNIIELSTRLHAQVVNSLLKQQNLTPEQVDVIGYHGQTLYHSPQNRITIQAGVGDLLAKLTGIKVVDDFRIRDVEAGGQGAPLVPLYHQALAIRDKLIPVAVINCGGIANISVINGPNPQDIVGFDTGPGNGLVDLFVKIRTSGQQYMDENGKYGLKGKICEDILDSLHNFSVEKGNKNYFDIKPPKSLDIKDLKLIDQLKELSIEDGCATLEAFTADSIVSEMKHVKQVPKQWVMVGGGWNNPVIKRELINRLQEKIDRNIEVYEASQVGWNTDAMEAQTFGFFAVRHLLQLPISFPNITGVPKEMTGGTLHLPPSVCQQ